MPVLTGVCDLCSSEDEESGAQALYQLHSEVRALKVCVCLVMVHDFTLFLNMGFI